MTNKILFEGSAVALVTPYRENGSVNYPKLEELINFQIENGTDAILVCGTTGEASTMTDCVQVNVVKHAAKFVNKRVPLLVGAGSNDTLHGMKLSYAVQEAGADAILSVTPYYNKTTQKGLIEHYSQIARSVDIPVILYNVKSRTGMNIEPKTVKVLSEIPNICGIKECNSAQVGDIRKLCGENFAIYSGEDDFVVQVLAIGGNGVISVAANIVPRDVSEMVHSFLSGDVKKARMIQLDLLDLIKALFIEVNPIPVKTAMNMMGMKVGNCVLPLTTMESENYYKLKKVLENYMMQHPRSIGMDNMS